MQWLRWKPTNYLQVWLLAFGIGLIVIVAFLVSGGRAFGIWYAVSLFVVAGVAESTNPFLKAAAPLSLAFAFRFSLPSTVQAQAVPSHRGKH